MCITSKPLNLHLLFEREHQILCNALTVLFKYFIYASLFSKQHFRIANCIQANEKLVTPRFTPFREVLSCSFQLHLRKSAAAKTKGKSQVKLRKPQTLLTEGQHPATSMKSTLPAMPVESSQAVLQPKVITVCK